MPLSGDGTEFYYIETMFYGAKDTEKNRVQVAYGYRKQVIACRYYYNGTWSDWIKQNREITRATYNSTATKSNSTNSWQYMKNSAFNAELEAGKYLGILSFMITGGGSGVATVRPLVDGKEISNAHRCSIPVANSLTMSGQVVFYKDLTAGTHTLNAQIYANVATTTNTLNFELYKIGEV